MVIAQEARVQIGSEAVALFHVEHVGAIANAPVPRGTNGLNSPFRKSSKTDFVPSRNPAVI
jgi:hypothetical protein